VGKEQYAPGLTVPFSRFNFHETHRITDLQNLPLFPQKYEGPVAEDRAFFDFKTSMAQMPVIPCKLSGRNLGTEGNVSG
jgi:hypothetical protein